MPLTSVSSESQYSHLLLQMEGRPPLHPPTHAVQAVQAVAAAALAQAQGPNITRQPPYAPSVSFQPQRAAPHQATLVPPRNRNVILEDEYPSSPSQEQVELAYVRHAISTVLLLEQNTLLAQLQQSLVDTSNVHGRLREFGLRYFSFNQLRTYSLTHQNQFSQPQTQATTQLFLTQTPMMNITPFDHNILISLIHSLTGVKINVIQYLNAGSMLIAAPSDQMQKLFNYNDTVLWDRCGVWIAYDEGARDHLRNHCETLSQLTEILNRIPKYSGARSLPAIFLLPTGTRYPQYAMKINPFEPRFRQQETQENLP